MKSHTHGIPFTRLIEAKRPQHGSVRFASYNSALNVCGPTTAVDETSTATGVLFRMLYITSVDNSVTAVAVALVTCMESLVKLRANCVAF